MLTYITREIWLTIVYMVNMGRQDSKKVYLSPACRVLMRPDDSHEESGNTGNILDLVKKVEQGSKEVHLSSTCSTSIIISSLNGTKEYHAPIFLDSRSDCLKLWLQDRSSQYSLPRVSMTISNKTDVDGTLISIYLMKGQSIEIYSRIIGFSIAVVVSEPTSFSNTRTLFPDPWQNISHICGLFEVDKEPLLTYFSSRNRLMLPESGCEQVSEHSLCTGLPNLAPVKCFIELPDMPQILNIPCIELPGWTQESNTSFTDSPDLAQQSDIPCTESSDLAKGSDSPVRELSDVLPPQGSFGKIKPLNLVTEPGNFIHSIMDNCNAYQTLEGLIPVIDHPFSVFTETLLSDMYISFIILLFRCNFRLDFFFSLQLNTLLFQSVSNNNLVNHLPLVSGELETIIKLLYDASYAHSNDCSLFLKVAHRAELIICYTTPLQDALQFYNYCIDVAFKIGDEVAEARMLIVYGQLLGRCKENLGLAYQQFRRALRLLEPRGKSIDMAWLLTATGWNLFSRGWSTSGKQYLVQACQMFKDLIDFSTGNDRHSSLFSLGQGFLEEEQHRLEQKYAAALSSLGLVDRHLNNHDEALAHIQRSLDIRRGLWDQHQSIGNTYNNISICYQRLGEKEEALNNSLKGLEVKRTCKASSTEMITSLNNVALNCSSVTGDHVKAISLLEEALGLHKETGLDKPDVVVTFTSLAFVYQRNGKVDIANLWYQKAVDLGRRIHEAGKEEATWPSVNRLAHVMLQMANYQEALNILEEQVVSTKDQSIAPDQSFALLQYAYLKTGEDRKAMLAKERRVDELVTLLRTEKDVIAVNQVQETKGNKTNENVTVVEDQVVEDDIGCIDSKQHKAITNIVSSSEAENIEDTNTVNDHQDNIKDLDDVDSDNDLYGPDEDTVLEDKVIETSPQRISDSQYATDTVEQSGLQDGAIRDSNEEDRMSTTSTPESFCQNFVEDEDDGVEESYHSCVGITTDITSSNEVQLPVPKPLARFHHRSGGQPVHSQPISHHISIGSSRQSAFTVVRSSSLSANSNIPEHQLITSPCNQNRSQALTQGSRQPLSQFSPVSTDPSPMTPLAGHARSPNRLAPTFSNPIQQVSFRQFDPDNVFHSSQSGYRQALGHPLATCRPSLPVRISETHRETTLLSESLFGDKLMTPHPQNNRSVSGGDGASCEDTKEDMLLPLTLRQINGSNNVLRLILGDISEDGHSSSDLCKNVDGGLQ